jgi:superfamily II DNA or RNA helicase
LLVVDQIKEYINFLFKDSKYKLRDYQEESVIRGIQNKRGTFELAVNAGKSSILYTIIDRPAHQDFYQLKMMLADRP